MKVDLHKLNVNVVLAFSEYLFAISCSAAMVANHISALKVKGVIFNLKYELFDSLKVKFFFKSVEQRRPLHVASHNIIDIHMLKKICKECDKLYMGVMFKAIFSWFLWFYATFKPGPSCFAGFRPR